MKTIFHYFLFFGIGMILFLSLISASKNPETAIVGSWNELAWEYEKVNKNDTLKRDFDTISTYVKEVVGQNLIIHKAEKWVFLPKGKLLLKGTNYTKEVNWCIKGRGNILELKYDNANTEHYNIGEISKNKLTLNFESDTHTRGIVRLTFKK